MMMERCLYVYISSGGSISVSFVCKYCDRSERVSTSGVQLAVIYYLKRSGMLRLVVDYSEQEVSSDLIAQNTNSRTLQMRVQLDFGSVEFEAERGLKKSSDLLSAGCKYRKRSWAENVL